ncbi:CLAVATA3/ESR-RELATED 25 [Euphorbia peplus]|nr:CLAVATA3/ESR-RELATED 25 [Euphorbia peplus]
MVRSVGGLKMMLLALVLGLVWFVSPATAKTNTMAVTVESSNKHEELHQFNGREKQQLIYDPHLNSNYMMSKRKVPNGPDPIHNRKAGNSKRPPGLRF